MFPLYLQAQEGMHATIHAKAPTLAFPVLDHKRSCWAVYRFIMNTGICTAHLTADSFAVLDCSQNSVKSELVRGKSFGAYRFPRTFKPCRSDYVREQRHA